MMKQLCASQGEGVTPLALFPDGPSVLEDFGGHLSDHEVAFPDRTITALFLYLVLVTKHSSVLSTLG